MSILVKNDDHLDGIMDGQKAVDTKLLVECVTILQKHYPNHFWHAMMYSDKSMIAIRNLDVSSKIGYKLNTSRVQSDLDLKCVVMAGGELLERAGLIRGMHKEDATHFDTTNSANDLDPKYHNQKAKPVNLI